LNKVKQLLWPKAFSAGPEQRDNGFWSWCWERNWRKRNQRNCKWSGFSSCFQSSRFWWAAERIEENFVWKSLQSSCSNSGKYYFV